MVNSSRRRTVVALTPQAASIGSGNRVSESFICDLHLSKGTDMRNMPNRRGNAVRTQTPKRAVTAFAVGTLGTLGSTAPCGGGPAGALYDLIAEVSDKAEVAPDNLEGTRAESDKATTAKTP